MNNGKKKDLRIKTVNKFSKMSRRGLKGVSTSSVPESYYKRIQSKRAVTKHHPVWEALNDVLVLKGGRVCVK